MDGGTRTDPDRSRRSRPGGYAVRPQAGTEPQVGAGNRLQDRGQHARLGELQVGRAGVPRVGRGQGGVQVQAGGEGARVGGGGGDADVAEPVAQDLWQRRAQAGAG